MYSPHLKTLTQLHLVLCRVKFEAYLFYSILISAFIYPISAHWAWAPNGFLRDLGFQDFAGGTVVHALGAVCAVVAAKVVGPRYDRFTQKDTNGKLGISVKQIKGHSAIQQCQGALYLMVGWLCFNSGSVHGLSNGGVPTVSRAALNTLLAAGVGASVGTVWGILKRRMHDLTLSLNGMMVALVAITAGCDDMEPWATCLIAASSVFMYLGVSHVITNVLHIDDVVEAFAVHGAGGIWGTFMLSFFSMSRGIFYFPIAGFEFLGKLRCCQGL